jgi:xanthine dehydrogenase accessory factor
VQSLDLDVLQTALAWKQAGRRVWLVTVTRTFGASPRPPGSLLAMRDDGIFVGSVSGGCIEDDLLLRRDEYHGRRPQFAFYGVDGEEARRFGLPCGGTLEVMIEAEVNDSDLRILLDRIAHGDIVTRTVSLDTGVWEIGSGTALQECERGESFFTSVHGPRWRMLLIGASEIARYIAEIAGALDFQVFVCDPREEYCAAWRLSGTQWLDGMPDDAVVDFRPDGHTVILAVSHDPKLDDLALIEALKADAFYVGAVGSKKTSEDRRARLHEFELSEAQLARLHGPVGLPLGSRTPPEIAIAILADLVAARNGVSFGAAEKASSPSRTNAAP